MTARVLGALILSSVCSALLAAQEGAGVRRIVWDDVAALGALLEPNGITPHRFGEYVERVRDDNGRRIREGDLDHLVFYVLQSTRFTSAPPIEPALSAKAFVERLVPADRDRFLRDGGTPPAAVPADVRARIAAFLRGMEGRATDPRLAFFGDLVAAAFPDPADRERRLAAEYIRAMRFLYQKEFGARAAGERVDRAAVAELYRTRGLSTDTAVEAGYLVYTGLGVARALDSERRVARALIVGPGIDLAPRTGYDESAPPESYQPWAVLDALIGLGASTLDDLELVAADINPRVVRHLEHSRRTPPVLTLAGEIRESDTVTLSAEYRDYFSRLGRAIGVEDTAAAPPGELRKILRVAPRAAAAVRAVQLDIVTERLTGPRFDLVVATNILPYFDDGQLMLAMSNVAAMLAPGGVFIHNEARPVLQEITDALGLPFEHSRHAVIATVRGAPAPLFDSVFLHRRK